MFDIFDGMGSELATLLWVVFIPTAIAIIRWYVTEREERTKLLAQVGSLEEKVKGLRERAAWKDSITTLEEAIDALELSTKKFDAFIVRYETMETETQKRINELIEKAEDWGKFKSEWKGYQRAQAEKSGRRMRPDVE